MRKNDWNDLTSFDYLSASPRDREEIKREAIRRAYAERAAMMDMVIGSLPRLIHRLFVRLTARTYARPAIIRRKEIVQV
jgi:hypothetical protein